MLYCTIVLAVRWYCGGRPNCELWQRLITLQGVSYGTLTHSSHCVEKWETKVGHEIIFLSRVSILTRDNDIANLSVRYVPIPYENGLTLHIVIVFAPYGSQSFCFYQHQTYSRNSDGVTPCGGAKYRWGKKISRFSTNMSLYHANDTIYRHSCYGRRIGTRMRSIKWFHFQWPWTNPNPVFKVTPLSDAKYLTNGYRYGHSYYRRRIGNRTQAFEWHQFQ